MHNNLEIQSIDLIEVGDKLIFNSEHFSNKVSIENIFDDDIQDLFFNTEDETEFIVLGKSVEDTVLVMNSINKNIYELKYFVFYKKEKVLTKSNGIEVLSSSIYKDCIKNNLSYSEFITELNNYGLTIKPIENS